jgi:predicted dinucleotide-binding enzyme
MGCRPGPRHRHHGPAVRQRRSGRHRLLRRTRGQGHRRHQQPFNSSGDGLDHPADTSIAQEAAKAAPAGARLVKGFNTIFRGVLENGRPDVFIAGDDPPAKAAVAEFIESLDLRPLDVGVLKMAYWLEGAGVVTMGLAANGVGNWDFALGVMEVTR